MKRTALVLSLALAFISISLNPTSQASQVSQIVSESKANSKFATKANSQFGIKANSQFDVKANSKANSKNKKYVATMQKAHKPSAPNNGTDDYRCFLLDPKVSENSIIKSVEFVPQNKSYVHHAIMFRVTGADLPEAIAADKNGQGWPCFGGSGLGSMFSSFLTSPWLSSWAPGRGKDVSPKGYGIPFKKGERLVLQVHYNLLAATGDTLKTDRSKILLEAIPAKGSTVKQLNVELFAAPVELACPAGVTGPLCDRKKSLIDLASRTSTASAFEAVGINVLCSGSPFDPKPSLVSRCDTIVSKDYDVIAAAPHMHLLGKSLKLILNPGTAKEQILLNRANYNFDDQSGTVLKKVISVKKGDVIRVECRFDPTLRQKLPALKSLAPRYVTWGEGSSDEMCLGVIAAN
jgi:hypothetical protein